MAKKKGSNDSPFPSLKNPWENNSNAVWLASSLHLYRNLDRFKFPGKLSTEECQQVVTLIERALGKAKGIKKPLLHTAEKMSPAEKEFFFEHFLASESFHQAHSGEAFVTEASGQFFGVLNVKEHLQLVGFDFKGELEPALNHLIEVESALSEQLTFAFSSRFGFLTADPYHCGTGLRARIFLQVPALVHSNKLSGVLDQFRRDGILASDLQGSQEEFVGDIVRLENNYTLGLDEEKVLSMMRAVATKLSAEEQALRGGFTSGQAGDIKDKVSRAYGLLTHSYQIETIEALNALSLIKLGIDLGWVDKASVKEVNALTFACRRASLQAALGENLESDALAVRRAEYLHDGLKAAVLSI